MDEARHSAITLTSAELVKSGDRLCRRCESVLAESRRRVDKARRLMVSTWGSPHPLGPENAAG